MTIYWQRLAARFQVCCAVGKLAKGISSSSGGSNGTEEEDVDVGAPFNSETETKK